MTEKLIKLIKTASGVYKFSPASLSEKCKHPGFQQFCFDEDEERMLAIDIRGTGYLLELIAGNWRAKNLGYVGHPTLISFNPANKLEVIVALTSGEIKIFKLNNVLEEYHTLDKNYQLPPTSISFNQSHCLISSRNEASIWDPKVYMKLHQFRLKNIDCYIKKAMISPSRLIVMLYDNDILQIWHIENFDVEKQLCLHDYDLRVVKDFVFTENGRAMVICTAKKIVIFNTISWCIMKRMEMLENIRGVRRLITVPLPLDDGFNKIIAVIFNDGNLKFLDLSATSFVESSDNNSLECIHKMIVSAHGQWIAWIQYDGSLNISSYDQLMKLKPKRTQIKSATIKPKPKSHHINQHLKYIQHNVTNILKLPTLQGILQEFGEYPERHRTTIWTTLMKLPGNRKAFLGLSSQNSIGLPTKVLNNFQLADKNTGTLLALNTDRLIQLFPFFDHSSFLPELIFPFVIVFKKNPLFAHEAILTVLLNFCQKWFEYYPFPPLNILGIIENILIEVDPILAKFYYENGITSTQYAWPLLKTMMSEVLTGTEWLILWDHLLSYKKPLLLLLCIIAYSICLRQTIFSLVKNKQDIEKFFGQQGHIQAKELIKVSLQLDCKISDKNHPRQYLRDSFCVLPQEGSYPTTLIEEYPKFLVENAGKIKEMKNMQEWEDHFQKKRHDEKLITEQHRIMQETKNYLEEIQQERIREFEKCYGEQGRSVEIFQQNTQHQVPKQIITSVTSKPTRSAAKTSKQRKTYKKSGNKVKGKSVEQLKDDVQDLEEEIQTFLEISKSYR